MVIVWMISIVAIAVYLLKWLKNRRNKETSRLILKKLLISVVVMVVSFVIIGNTGSDANTKRDTTTSSDTSAKVVKKTKYVGKGEYKIAKKENLALIAKKKKLTEQEDDLQSQRDDIEKQEAEAKEQAQQAAEQQKRQAEQEQKQQESQAQQEQQTQSDNQQGDMNTADSGTIVGNSRSHIYHVPGQRGYNMNSNNAVYFKTEQDAINAGYRRSKV